MHTTARINELLALAASRRPAGPSDVAAAMGGAGIDYLTSDERAELHQLKLQLPTMADERAAAQARIAARVAARRAKVAA